MAVAHRHLRRSVPSGGWRRRATGPCWAPRVGDADGFLVGHADGERPDPADRHLDTVTGLPRLPAGVPVLTTSPAERVRTDDT